MSEEVDFSKLTCDHCGARLMHSREWVMTGNPYWMRPWGGVLKMSEMIVPFACLGCGRVTFMLRDIHKLKRDFKELTPEEKEAAFSLD